MPKIIAHRGYTNCQPENTLSAFKAALATGADAIELDAQETSDGELVVHHDYYLGNPDNGEGMLAAKNLTYIKSLKIGQSEHIPNLEEVFAAIGNKLQYEIELKGYTVNFLRKVLALAKKYDLTQCIEFTSPHPYVLTKLKELDATTKTGMFVAPFPDWMDKKLGQTIALNNAILGGVNVLHCPVEIIDKQFVEAVHGKNLLVHAADCDTDTDITAAINAGVDQLSTNNLKLALAKVKNL